jgi:hypothetical protein
MSLRRATVNTRITPRGLTKEEAAEYCGCRTLAAFDQWRAKGIIPPAIPGTNNWDRKAIDLYLDHASQIVPVSGETELSPYDRWRAEHARKEEA